MCFISEQLKNHSVPLSIMIPCNSCPIVMSLTFENDQNKRRLK